MVFRRKKPAPPPPPPNTDFAYEDLDVCSLCGVPHLDMRPVNGVKVCVPCLDEFDEQEDE